jgi:hypothetical protein
MFLFFRSAAAADLSKSTQIDIFDLAPNLYDAMNAVRRLYIFYSFCFIQLHFLSRRNTTMADGPLLEQTKNDITTLREPIA